MTKTTGRAGQRGKSIEEVVSYAVGHRIRIEVLAILHEGVYCPNELADILEEPLGRVTHHVNELLDAGSIELARTEQVRNTTRHFYRAVELPESASQPPVPETEMITPRFYTDEEVAAMPPQQRQMAAGLILQASMAEALASLWAGKLIEDRRVFLSWRWFNVDARGREEIADEQARSWARIQEIEAEATARLGASEEEDPISVVVTAQGFVRSRTSPCSPPPVAWPANAE